MSYSTIGKTIKAKAGIAVLVWLMVALLSAVSVNAMSEQAEGEVEPRTTTSMPDVVKHRLETQASSSTATGAQ